ncbi:hypothetical protein JF50_13535 [Pseudoalteromonas luteoviolacea]|uniref:Uncharacterized protein n=1 Tax=Pseudoalteromonas luteoviolacea TaxID=43657 RepID=A0A0C1QBX2_9GAMM|nr:hypothetical protein JF50_13535 [Pseudoalteromonas luteoviolacea]
MSYRLFAYRAGDVYLKRHTQLTLFASITPVECSQKILKPCINLYKIQLDGSGALGDFINYMTLSPRRFLFFCDLEPPWELLYIVY